MRCIVGMQLVLLVCGGGTGFASFVCLCVFVSFCLFVCVRVCARVRVQKLALCNYQRHTYTTPILHTGVIAFCPLNACSPLTARRIGVLQPFYIKHMPTPGGESNTVVLEDAKIARTIRRVSQPPLFGYDRGPTGFSGLPGMPPPRADR